ncbi:rhodanese-like domain-containing protein 17 isoform X3 [Trifolium pratense]|uniref:Uncharacterized protein n=2 Tax=Trifolium pratense TaxID=57577 RepID=A0ACB0JST6_TRIPR|nr:rhodanese-like domain-containing protein 17 isoform X3 [Trifolium pratense]CAJ2646603.1 unnamed protein product [Trifolium pratense]
MAISLNLLPRCLVLLHFVLCSLGAKVVTIDVREANNLIQTGHIYLDVRTVQEFVKGPRVNTSKIINIPYMLDTPKGKVKNLYFLKECSSLCNIEDHLVVGCQFGLRSLHATSDLLDGGFKNVKNMDGGFAEWVSKMLPITNNSQVRP